MEEKNEREKYLSEIEQAICLLYEQYGVWQGLFKPENEKIFKEYDTFWPAVINGLKYGMVMQLAGLFHNDCKSINFYGVKQYIKCSSVENQIYGKIENDKNVKILWEYRRKIYAHEDKKVFDGKEKFVKEYDLDSSKLFECLELASQLLDDINSCIFKKELGARTNYDGLKESATNETLRIIKLLEN